MLKSLACVSLLAAIAFAARAAESPLTPERRAAANTAPLALDDIEVVGTLSIQQETALRIVRQALDEPRSYRREDFDTWRCWFERPTGTHFRHLMCARNGDLWALQPRGGGGGITGDDLIPTRIGDYGQILVSEKPMNEPKVRRMLARMAGPADNDATFIGMVLEGEEPPRDVPGAGELDRFAEAWAAVSRQAGAGATEEQQISAIQRAGLSLERYNRIAALVESYPYIHDEVADRLAGPGAHSR